MQKKFLFLENKHGSAHRKRNMICANSQMVQKKIMHECLCCACMYLVRKRNRDGENDREMRQILTIRKYGG